MKRARNRKHAEWGCQFFRSFGRAKSCRLHLPTSLNSLLIWIELSSTNRDIVGLPLKFQSSEWSEFSTGIHSPGWGRNKAIQYFAEATGKPSSVAIDEVIIAIENPGGLLYTIGRLQFQNMRSRGPKN